MEGCADSVLEAFKVMMVFDVEEPMSPPEACGCGDVRPTMASPHIPGSLSSYSRRSGKGSGWVWGIGFIVGANLPIASRKAMMTPSYRWLATSCSLYRVFRSCSTY
jgi:hypothetical protein